VKAVTIRRVNGNIVEHTVSDLGDKIERLAKPVAKAIDKIAGTKIAKCRGCKKMKDRLNAGMPFAEALKLRIKGL
jgi:hypothetical protein